MTFSANTAPEVGDHDSPLRACIHVNIIGAYGHGGDDPALVQLLDDAKGNGCSGTRRMQNTVGMARSVYLLLVTGTCYESQLGADFR